MDHNMGILNPSGTRRYRAPARRANWLCWPARQTAKCGSVAAPLKLGALGGGASEQSRREPGVSLSKRSYPPHPGTSALPMEKQGKARSSTPIRFVPSTQNRWVRSSPLSLTHCGSSMSLFATVRLEADSRLRHQTVERASPVTSRSVFRTQRGHTPSSPWSGCPWAVP